MIITLYSFVGKSVFSVQVIYGLLVELELVSTKDKLAGVIKAKAEGMFALGATFAAAGKV